MSTSKRARLEAQLIHHQEILDALYETMKDAASSKIHMMDLDTTEGRQETMEKRIDRIQDSIDKEEAKINSINSDLRRTGIIALNNRRR